MKTRAILPLFLFSFLLFSCKGSKKLQSTSTKVKSGKIVKPTMQNANAFKLFGISEDETYGYSEKNPIKVGGVDNSEGPKNERRYLNALAGPNGEEITYS
ncbi:MAG: 2-dehydro-3-deoxyphosphooctonate aldolase, partial [Bacteroidota bacterium]